jgi:hypothetical protein
MGRVRKTGYFLFFSTGFLIGGLIGIVTLNCFISYRIDQYHNKIKSLELIIGDRDLQLKKLEDTIDKKRLVVRNVDVILEDKEDELTKITLQKHIKEKLNKFIGKEVNKIDSDMLWEIIDQRILLIKDKEFSFQVNKLVISETIQIWIRVKSID